MSVDLSYPPWQHDRSVANHDWLQNRFLVALGKWENVRSGQVEDDEFEDNFVRSGLQKWRVQSIQLASLIERFETDMSPVQVLGGPPLSECDPETKAWLSDCIHSAWRRRIGLEALTSSAAEALRSANTSFEELWKAVSSAASDDDGITVSFALCRFRDSCQRLANCISQFPSEILVV